MKLSIAFLESPIGLLEVHEQSGVISCIRFVENSHAIHGRVENTLLNLAIRQLKEYFVGQRKFFELPFKQSGTDFQQRVWHSLLDIEYGHTKSYLDISMALGDKNLTRAVGNANGKNNIAIIVPCHRVIGNDNSLTGYAGGLWRKQWLLEHEGYNKQSQLSLFHSHTNK